MDTIEFESRTEISAESEPHYAENGGGKRELVDMLDKSGVLDRLLNGKPVLLSVWHNRSFAPTYMRYIHSYRMKATEIDKRMSEFLENGGRVEFGPPDTVRPRRW